jgi:hypothetical protein
MLSQAFIPKFQLEQDGIHLINENKLQEYDTDVRDALTKGAILTFEHVKPTMSYESTLSRKIDLKEGIPYQRRQNTFKRALHWGQLKLFLSEVEFLTKVLEQVKSANINKQIVMVYAGAAPGHHIGFLQKLFPTIIFELYDPNNFVVKDNAKLHTHVQFFTDVDANYWASRTDIYLVFCSDIRTEPATQENIVRNMNMQLKWWQIINPELSMFKFRLPWEEGITIYPVGEIYAQAFPGPTSSETRLIVKKNANLCEYDNKQYESACFYHNTVTREKKYTCKLGKLNIGRDKLDNCYDCVSFVNIMENYLKVVGRKTLDLRKIIIAVQQEISFGRSDIYIKTAQYFDNTFDTFKKLCYLPCKDLNCAICPNSIKEVNPIARGFSKATIASEDIAIQKAIEETKTQEVAKINIEQSSQGLCVKKENHLILDN